MKFKLTIAKRDYKGIEHLSYTSTRLPFGVRIGLDLSREQILDIAEQLVALADKDGPRYPAFHEWGRRKTGRI